MSLLRLPNELLLMVVSHLALIRPFNSHDSHIDAFQRYQDETERRLSALAALCRTSKTLYNITTPELYSAVVSYSGDSYVRLMGFLRTLIAKPELQKKVNYIHRSSYKALNVRASNPSVLEPQWRSEKQSTDSLLNLHPTLAKEAMRIWKSYPEILGIWHEIWRHNVPQAILAVIIARASNLEHLAIITALQPEAQAIRLFNLCATTIKQSYPQYTFTFPRLRDLVLSNQRSYFEDPIPLGKVQFLKPASTCPSLRHIQLFGYLRLAGPKSMGQKLLLDRLQLCNSNIFSQVAHQISSCTALVHLNINWPALWLNDSLPGLYEALLCHKDTLKSLAMDIRDSLSTHIHTGPLQSLGNLRGSFASLTALRSLRIPDIMLLGIPPTQDLALAEVDRWWAVNSGTYRISDLLPPSLEKLGVYETLLLGTNIPILHDLVHDKARLPCLRFVELRSHVTRDVCYLEETFASHGVSFRAVMLPHSLSPNTDWSYTS